MVQMCTSILHKTYATVARGHHAMSETCFQLKAANMYMAVHVCLMTHSNGTNKESF